MIYLGFILDYLVMQLLPFNTYFVIADIDDNNFISVCIIGLLIDLMYRQFPFNLLIFSCLFLILKMINIKKKNKWLKNIILFIIYFGITILLYGGVKNILYIFFIGILLQLFYLVMIRKL